MLGSIRLAEREARRPLRRRFGNAEALASGAHKHLQPSLGDVHSRINLRHSTHSTRALSLLCGPEPGTVWRARYGRKM